MVYHSSMCDCMHCPKVHHHTCKTDNKTSQKAFRAIFIGLHFNQKDGLHSYHNPTTLHHPMNGALIKQSVICNNWRPVSAALECRYQIEPSLPPQPKNVLEHIVTATTLLQQISLPTQPEEGNCNSHDEEIFTE
jgi:phenylpropionate dioxygenase-like ring-hydroxylating dioxygenase large terminal subunit